MILVGITFVFILSVKTKSVKHDQIFLSTVPNVGWIFFFLEIKSKIFLNYLAQLRTIWKESIKGKGMQSTSQLVQSQRASVQRVKVIFHIRYLNVTNP